MNSTNLRRWQQRALEKYQKTQPRIFTCLATPASGKTRFGLAIAQSLLNTSEVKQTVIFCHTDQIRRQWQAAAQQLGIELSVNTHQSKDGYIFSYQQLTDDSFVEKANYLIRGRRRSLVILDEPHHLADSKAWGDGVKTALKRVHKILLLSGTLFRHDEGVIPFVSYRDGVLVPDFEYSYSEALKDRVVGPVYFPVYGGEASWQFSGRSTTAEFGEELSDRNLSRQLNTAITSKDWLSSVIEAAEQRLQEVRQTDPAAGGLITAKDIRHARLVAQVVESVTGTAPAIALSDNSKADQVISDFAESKESWLVAVRMVSEGVDIPRLRVGVYATNILTELFFRQVVGRLVRTEGSFIAQDAYLYIPQHPVLLKYAMGIAEERYHVLPELSIPGSHSTREVFSFLEPVSAIALPGEILSPVSPPNGELLAMLHQGLALLDQAQASIGQARDLFNQVAVALPVSAPEHSHISREPQRLSLSDAENHLLTLLAVHRGANISKTQLERLSAQRRMDFYDALTKLKMEGWAVFQQEFDGLMISAEGIAQIGEYLPAPIRSGGDVIQLWSDALTSRQVALLKGLFLAHPRWIERKELVRLAGYSESMARNIGSDLKELAAYSLAEERDQKLFRINSKVVDVPFSGYF